VNRKVIGITGFKNSGKTTLLERLVRNLTARGYRIATIKHAHHAFDIDHQGRDSYRHRAAGAREVAIVSRNLWAVVRTLGDEPEPTLADVLATIGPADLIMVEGYKRDSYPKIEVRNLALDHSALDNDDGTVVAIAASGPVAGAAVPVFSRDDVEAISDFVVARMELEGK
jgi:molybdopterin-guanine dinucleotide biosynthesis adapter protein